MSHQHNSPPVHDEATVLVVGAGPTGLGAAWRLANSGRSGWILAEGADRFGGLSGSTRDQQGFVWDYGGHVTFSRFGIFNQAMDRLLGRDGWIQHRRNAAVRVFDRWVPFPLQRNLDYLPEDLRSLLAPDEQTQRSSPRHFGEWAAAHFGRGMVEHFFQPYNEKLWARPIDTLDWRWNADRVAPPAEAASGKQRAEQRNWGPNAGFRYPATGGAGEPWQRLGELLQLSTGGSVRLGTRLTSISLEERTARFDDGSTIGYDWLVSTIPLDRLVAMSDAPLEIVAESQKLERTTVHLTGLGFRGQPPSEISDRTWLYFPSVHVPYYRASLLSAIHETTRRLPKRHGRYWSNHLARYGVLGDRSLPNGSSTCSQPTEWWTRLQRCSVSGSTPWTTAIRYRRSIEMPPSIESGSTWSHGGF